MFTLFLLYKVVRFCMRPLLLFFLLSPLMLATLSCVSNAYAEQTPLRLASDHRIETVSYADNNVTPITGSPFINTQIRFGDDETIQLIEGGDAAGWTVDRQDYSLYIKPTSNQSAGNLTVVTDRHTYYFTLAVNPHATPIYAVKFVYSDETKLQQEGVLSPAKSPSQYNWNYSFNGDKRMVPLHVYDDGQFTYMQLQPNQTVPSVFAVTNEKGQESVVNFRQRGDILVIQQVAPQFTLRSGDHLVASIFNNKQIEQLHRNHWGV